MAPRRQAAYAEPDPAPVRAAPVRTALAAIEEECRRFSQELHAYVTRLPEAQGDAQVAAFVRESGRHFTKWNLEILHLLATHRELRFGGLEARLPGISSRTLSRKLVHLQTEGFVRRSVRDGRPPAVAYGLTPDGYRFAQLLAPLVVYLAERRAGGARRP